MAARGQILLLLLFFSFSLYLSFASQEEVSQVVVSATLGQPWPFPMSYKSTEQVNVVNVAAFRFIAVDVDCDILREAFLRYQRTKLGRLADKIQTMRKASVPLRYTCSFIYALKKRSLYYPCALIFFSFFLFFCCIFYRLILGLFKTAHWARSK